jgi:hypothetical protein
MFEANAHRFISCLPLVSRLAVSVVATANVYNIWADLGDMTEDTQRIKGIHLRAILLRL